MLAGSNPEPRCWHSTPQYMRLRRVHSVHYGAPWLAGGDSKAGLHVVCLWASALPLTRLQSKILPRVQSMILLTTCGIRPQILSKCCVLRHYGGLMYETVYIFCPAFCSWHCEPLIKGLVAHGCCGKIDTSTAAVLTQWTAALVPPCPIWEKGVLATARRGY